MDFRELLARFDGVWKGSGRGFFPTIVDFEYVETVRFRTR